MCKRSWVTGDLLVTRHYYQRRNPAGTGTRSVCLLRLRSSRLAIGVSPSESKNQRSVRQRAWLRSADTLGYPGLQANAVRRRYTRNMEVRLTPEVENELASIAARSSRTPQQVAAELLTRGLRHERQFIE